MTLGDVGPYGEYPWQPIGAQGPVVLKIGVVLGPVLNLSKSFYMMVAGINRPKPFSQNSIGPSYFFQD